MFQLLYSTYCKDPECQNLNLRKVDLRKGQLPQKPMHLPQKPMLAYFRISPSTVLYALNPTKAVNLPQKPLLAQGDVADLAAEKTFLQRIS